MLYHCMVADPAWMLQQCHASNLKDGLMSSKNIAERDCDHRTAGLLLAAVMALGLLQAFADFEVPSQLSYPLQQSLIDLSSLPFHQDSHKAVNGSTQLHNKVMGMGQELESIRGHAKREQVCALRWDGRPCSNERKQQEHLWQLVMEEPQHYRARGSAKASHARLMGDGLTYE
jgi:hypothetical protein